MGTPVLPAPPRSEHGADGIAPGCFPSGISHLGGLPQMVSAPRSRVGGPSWQAGTPVCKTCRKGPSAGAVGIPRQGSPTAWGSTAVTPCRSLAPGRGSHPVRSPWQFPSPLPLQGGAGHGFPFRKSEKLQDGNPRSRLQKHTHTPPALEAPGFITVMVLGICSHGCLRHPGRAASREALLA